jgi:hypothetical protein
MDGQTLETDSKPNGLQIHPALRDTVHEVCRTLPDKTWTHFSPEFFVSFWQLSLYDISVPKDRYQAEVSKLKALILALDADRSDMTSSAVLKRRREKERALATILQMQSELDVHEKHHQRVMERLWKEKDSWFKKGLCCVSKPSREWCLYDVKDRHTQIWQ